MQIEISDEIAVRIDWIIERILSDPDSESYVYKFEPPIDLRPILNAERILPMMFDWSVSTVSEKTVKFSLLISDLLSK